MSALEQINKTMKEIKTLNSKVDAEFKRINTKVDRLQNSLVSRIIGVEESLSAIEGRVVANEAVVRRVLDSPPFNQSVDVTLSTCISEMANREHRKANLLVHGLDDTDVRKSDLDNINSLLAPLMNTTVNVLRCQRLGVYSAALARPRPIVITLNNDTATKLLLQAFRALRAVSPIRLQYPVTMSRDSEGESSVAPAQRRARGEGGGGEKDLEIALPLGQYIIRNKQQVAQPRAAPA